MEYLTMIMLLIVVVFLNRKGIVMHEEKAVITDDEYDPDWDYSYDEEAYWQRYVEYEDMLMQYQERDLVSHLMSMGEDDTYEDGKLTILKEKYATIHGFYYKRNHWYRDKASEMRKHHKMQRHTIPMHRTWEGGMM